MKYIFHIMKFFSYVLTTTLFVGWFTNGRCGELNDSLRQKNVNFQLNEALLLKLEDKMNAAIINGISSPVFMVGEARLKIQYHSMAPDTTSFMYDDRSWIQSGWEGNEGLLRLGTGVSLGRYGSILSKIGFQHTLPGNYVNKGADSSADLPGSKPLQNRHDKSDNPAYIHEDLFVGVNLITKPASFKLKFGGIQWDETSPLTIWEYQPRLFAWDYLPHEIEESVAAFYYKNMVVGERTGRVAWNKKPFYGIGLESTCLPWDMYVDAFYGSFEVFDRHEREYVNLNDDLSYHGSWPVTAAKGKGTGDSYRHTVYGRLAKRFEKYDNEGNADFFNVGVNFVGVIYDEDIKYNDFFRGNFYTISESMRNNRIIRDTLHNNSFYKEPWIVSTDFKGKITDKLMLHADIACSMVDTTWLTHVGNSLDVLSAHRRSGPKPAVYAGIGNTYLLPLRLDFFFAQPGFYSPFSFAKAMDGFFPFGANLVGKGKFVASAYTQNMAGFNCSISPLSLKKNGHCKITYGNHVQVEPGPDILYFPHRLNGADLFSIFHSSYSRWGLDLLDNSMNGTYNKRLGDESFKRRAHGNPSGPEAGGIRSDALSMYESFVPYEFGSSADSNLVEDAYAFERSESIPSHRKFTFNGEIDASYNMATLFGGNKTLFLSAYAAVNGISTSAQLLSAKSNSKNMLWGCLVRSEVSVELTDRLYVLGLAGFENWYAEKAWMESGDTSALRVPIDYRDFACGLGCDWQVFDRVGLHLRSKWMKHADMQYPDNDWKTPVFSGELKMWF